MAISQASAEQGTGTDRSAHVSMFEEIFGRSRDTEPEEGSVVVSRDTVVAFSPDGLPGMTGLGAMAQYAFSEDVDRLVALGETSAPLPDKKELGSKHYRSKVWGFLGKDGSKVAVTPMYVVKAMELFGIEPKNIVNHVRLEKTSFPILVTDPDPSSAAVVAIAPRAKGSEKIEDTEDPCLTTQWIEETPIQALQTVDGVGPKTTTLLKRAGIMTVEELRATEQLFLENIDGIGKKKAKTLHIKAEA